jgi:hypothetical protein
VQTKQKVKALNVTPFAKMIKPEYGSRSTVVGEPRFSRRDLYFDLEAISSRVIIGSLGGSHLPHKQAVASPAKE